MYVNRGSGLQVVVVARNSNFYSRSIYMYTACGCGLLERVAVLVFFRSVLT